MIPGSRRNLFCFDVRFVVDMCVLEPMPAARAHAVRARAVHPRAGRVVHLSQCSVPPDRATPACQRRRHRGGAPARALCWRCACLRCRACVWSPCSRCVYLLCMMIVLFIVLARNKLRKPVRLLCMRLLCMRLLCMLALCALALPMLALRAPAVRALAVRARAVRFRAVCGVLVQRSSTSCGARRHCIPVDPGDLPCPLPFPHSQSHMPALVMHCSSPFAPFLACVAPPFCPISCLCCCLPFAMRF